MKLSHGLHLAYCTNIHRGETWRETFEALNTHTLAVRQRVCPDQPYAIGLRLSNQAAQELNDPTALRDFRRWLDKHHCYVFTINGFPFGRFHGQRVKEQVYRPDWTSPERLEYTNLLFELLSRLVPEGIDGGVSTLPGAFKLHVCTPEELKEIRTNLWQCVTHVARVSEQTGHRLHLDLEPEPLGLLETSGEVMHFFDRMRSEHPNDPRLEEHLRVNYDTCHLAIEFEEPADVVALFQRHKIRIGKLHLSSALKVRPTPEARQALAAFADDVYLHQVVARSSTGELSIFVDLDQALAQAAQAEPAPDAEWRIHFHIPLHCSGSGWFEPTTDHLLGVLDILAADPTLCSHLEMETYTWEVLPPELKNRDVVEQLTAEYDWTLARLRERGLAAQ